MKMNLSEADLKEMGSGKGGGKSDNQKFSLGQGGFVY